MNNQPQFPLYIPTKGRYEYMITPKSLDRMGVPYKMVVEEQEYTKYLNAVNGDKSKVLVLDMAYKRNYELCDDLGLSKSTGPGPARNFAWDHALANGHKWHWVMDDNIKGFYRFNRNREILVRSPVFWKCMEDFVLRYKNVGMAGPNYCMFVTRRTPGPPFVMNTRIYSCNLIRNDVSFRWRGRYNEDTILSLDMLTHDLCTVQFNAFLQFKLVTQLVRGGNSGEFYDKEGTYPKSKMLEDVYPKYAKVVWKFSRVHHHVDYTPFKNNKLILKDGLEIPDRINEYGMKLKYYNEGDSIEN
jgi:hypothetical protein